MDLPVSPHSIQKICSVLSLVEETIICIYLTGSRLYGTVTPLSDYDYVIVLRDGTLPEGQLEHQISEKEEKIDGLLYVESQFLQLIQNHDFIALETLWLPPQFCLLQKKNYLDSFILDGQKMRSYVSENSNYSWVRAKKKLIVEKDFNPYRARKTLWHAFRVLDYGMQVLSSGKIVNYQSMVTLFLEIYNNESVEWIVYQNLYKKKFNRAKTDFRLLAPKELPQKKQAVVSTVPK